MRRFIHRSPDGTMLGHYANPQEFRTEEVEHDHPDIVAWQKAKDARVKKRGRQRADPEAKKIKALTERLAALEAQLEALTRDR